MTSLSQLNSDVLQVVENVISSCPIDTRRALYGNIVLSVSFAIHRQIRMRLNVEQHLRLAPSWPGMQGGSTMFKDFGRRIQRDMTRQLAERLPTAPSRPEVVVKSHQMQRYAVWFGGSVLGMMPEFSSVCHTRQEYEEHGPSICRTNAVHMER